MFKLIINLQIVMHLELTSIAHLDFSAMNLSNARMFAAHL